MSTNIAAPAATSVFVRSPAPRLRHWRSNPISAPPSTAAPRRTTNSFQDNTLMNAPSCVSVACERGVNSNEPVGRARTTFCRSVAKADLDRFDDQHHDREHEIAAQRVHADRAASVTTRAARAARSAASSSPRARHRPRAAGSRPGPTDAGIYARRRERRQESAEQDLGEQPDVDVREQRGRGEDRGEHDEHPDDRRGERVRASPGSSTARGLPCRCRAAAGTRWRWGAARRRASARRGRDGAERHARDQNERGGDGHQSRVAGVERLGLPDRRGAGSG